MEFDMHNSRTMKHSTAARAGSLMAISALCGAAAAVGGAVDPVLASGKASAGSGSAQCAVNKLDGPSGATSSEVSAGSSDGMEQVGYARVDGETEAAWWSNGEASDLLPDFEEASAAAVSENIVVGTGIKPGEVERGSYLYYDGETRELEAPEGQRAEVFDINSEGESVGHGSGGSALRWRLDAEDEPRELSSPHGQAQALSIDDTGTVGGSAESEDGGTVPVIWDSDGEYRQLPVLDGAEHSMVSSISGDFAIGTSGASPDGSPDVLWNVADNTVTELPESIEANDVNDSGAVAATAEDGSAAVVDGEEVTELPDLAAGPSKAETISESGEVAGASRDAAGNWHAVIWTGC